MATPYGVPIASGYENIQLGNSSRKILKTLILNKNIS